MSIESLISNNPIRLTQTKKQNFTRKSLQHVLLVLQKHGFNVEKKLKYLNAGASSTVFIVDNKYVLKFTNEDSDVDNWTELIGHDIPNVADCIGVLYVGDYIKNYTHIIIQPYYPNEYNYYDNIFNFEIDVSEKILANLALPFNILWKDVVRYHDLALDNPKFKASKNLFRQLYDGMNALYYKKGIIAHDVHSDNIRFDSDGVLKIIDF
jgi:hypothetical protein